MSMLRLGTRNDVGRGGYLMYRAAAFHADGTIEIQIVHRENHGAATSTGDLFELLRLLLLNSHYWYLQQGDSIS